MGVKVRKRNGNWWVFIHHKGQRKAKAVGDKRTAELVAEKIRAKLTLGEFKIESKEPIKFMDYAQNWIRTYASVHCKESTVKEYQAIIRNHLAPSFANLTLLEITREAVKRLIAEKIESGLSRSTVSLILAPLIEMLNHAVEDGILASNPAARAGRFNRGRTEREARRFDCLTREELAHLLLAAKEHYPSYYPFILCAARTGMRFGELVGMQWGDIDFHNRFIEVRRSIHKGRISSPKAGKIRRVDMSAQLTEVLKGLRDLRLAEAAVKGTELEPSAWVFCNRDGSFLDSGNFYSRVWQPLLRKAGLRHLRFHDLRHTYASLLIQQGESLAYIRDQLGHHSIRVTVDTYGHLVPGSNRGAVDKLDEPAATKRNLYATEILEGAVKGPQERDSRT